MATTLAWLGDPAAVAYARHILARLESAADGPPRPRRAASARLDLSLALIAAGQHDEAAGTALEAITSGRIVPSNYWRAREVIRAIEGRGLPQAQELAEAYARHLRCGWSFGATLSLRVRRPARRSFGLAGRPVRAAGLLPGHRHERWRWRA